MKFWADDKNKYLLLSDLAGTVINVFGADETLKLFPERGRAIPQESAVSNILDVSIAYRCYQNAYTKSSIQTMRRDQHCFL